MPLSLPYCPRAVVLAHEFALESPLVESGAYDAMEFLDLTYQHEVSGVPHTAINGGDGTAVGAVPEDRLVYEIDGAIHPRH
ncbi:MAG TPA: thioredoxin family protein [Anaerolineaceae bacterium]|nr:thioredoxin family protein [Anaerolineaceae bacterium]